jgi:sugar/nucleoside kinase (ribokinase family)
MPNKFDCLCFGSFSVELLAWVDRYPGAGDGIHAEKAKWTVGGMAGNLAQAVARLGGKVALASVMGDDPIGDQAVEQLRQTGVDVEYVYRREGLISPVVVLMINPELKRAGLVLGVDQAAKLKTGEIPDTLLKSSCIFFTDMQPPETSFQVAKRAKELGLVVAFDMQMTEAHMNIPGLNKHIDRHFEITDYYFADQENFLTWTGERDLHTGCEKRLEVYREKTLVITNGIEGSLIATAEGMIEIPAFEVPVVDTIGAGDAYHGAFLYAHLILGWELEVAGLFASASAALSCTRAGARDGLPDMAQVMALLNENGFELPK